MGRGIEPVNDYRVTSRRVADRIGQRLRAVRPYLDGEDTFLANYSDGLCDLHLPDLIDFHREHNATASFLTVKPMESFHTIEADDVRRVVRAETAGPPVALAGKPAPGATTQPPTLREFKEWSERAFLVDKLREHDWNISKTADVIDTPRSNLYKKLEQYQISQETDG